MEAHNIQKLKEQSVEKLSYKIYIIFYNQKDKAQQIKNERDEERRAELDKRTGAGMLDSFLQEQVSDYSFLPPDRRQADSEFFLPDFNETELSPQTIVFAVDTSGSIDEKTLSAVYTEISSAIEQFDGNLMGVLLFFDTRVYPPIPFSAEEDLTNVLPVGGGGTDFSCLFSYLASSSLNPASIVIFTDGQGEIPDERAAGNVPVLWLLSRDGVSVPWGKCAFLKP